MEQRNSEEIKFLALNEKCFFLLVDFDSRADIMTRYTFNQVRRFFTFSSIDFMV